MRAMLAAALMLAAPGCVVIQCDGAERVAVSITIGPRILSCDAPDAEER